MSVTAIIQARMGSSRLPGKALLTLGGKPVLQHVVERAAAAATIDSVIVATTVEPADDALVGVARRIGVAVHRGHPTDVLDRYAGAARTIDSDVIVRLTGDDPVKDPALIDAVVARMMQAPGRYDYVSNTNPPSFPEGLDVEAMPRTVLLEAARLARSPYDREHVTPFLYRPPGRYRVLNLALDGEDHSHQRWTLDTDADRRFFEALFAHLPPDAIMPWREILALLARHPEISSLNAAVPRSAQYTVSEGPSPP